MTAENVLGNDNATSLETSFFPDSGVETTSIRLGIRTDYEVSKNLRLTGILGYNDLDRNAFADATFGGGDIRRTGGFNPRTFSLSAPPIMPNRVGFITGDNEQFEDSSLELRINYDNGRTRYLLGIYRYDSEESGDGATSFAGRAAYAGAPFAFQGKDETESISVFGSLDHQFAGGWSIGGEFRYNKDEINFDRQGDGSGLVASADFNAFLPKLTIANKPNDETMYYLTLAKGNKPGDLNTSDGVPAADIAVEEENALSYELGLKTTALNGALAANLALYHIDWEDLQVTQTVAAVVNGQNRTFSILDNVGKASISGLELSLNYQATDFWNINLGYAYTDSNIDEYLISVAADASPVPSSFREAALIFGYQDDASVNITGTQLPQTSKHQLNLSNSFTGAFNDEWQWYARADVNFSSKRYAQVYNLAHTGDRTLVNTRIGTRNDNLELELWATNLLDDDTPTALVRYVQANDITLNPFNRAIAATLPDQRRFGVTARYSF